MPVEKGPGRSLYQTTIVTERCGEEFKARIPRILLLTPRSAVGVDVTHDPFPDFVAESKETAERRAEAFFKAWATIERLAWKVKRKTTRALLRAALLDDGLEGEE